MTTDAQYGLPSSAVAALHSVFCKWTAIDSVWLYGSRAKGNYRPGSDIDLSIRGQKLGLSDLLAIENQIDDLFLPWSVDLSLFDNIDNPSLREHIERVGVVLYSSENKSR
ncbi:MAG TPA: nucleotidyltransferase domain-containing protein [Pseudomonas xinjiangensis]|uniref:Nucleotidyltransferase domain-containing protein n=2 Tax=root TaxID=1 RepID=A0A7V1BM70_9GAMM|nr:nucleotidyltransferase domain-containing protein [Halopseudomonas xinjiangensis]HEC46820.1 nucleotidyltransferase domain-containing protein [Halopseudomonas xinjiangensis]